MKRIELSRGKFCLVDDDDFDEINKLSWHYHIAGKIGYATRGPDSTRMHRQIMSAPKGIEVDHINGDKLDNRKSNLRLCNRASNCRNCKKRSDTKNKYKGVHYVKSRNRWIARIQFNRKRTHSRMFMNEIDAAHEYDSMAKSAFGEFANTNFS